MGGVKIRKELHYDFKERIPFDKFLIPQLDSLVYNIKNDWDFVIIITGNRMVRTGKSVLAMNICKYLSLKLNTPYTADNIFLSSKEMMKASFKMPKHSIIHYDEGAESLRRGSSYTSFQYNLINYFNEVGQMNHIFVIVLPDFFDLTEQIAVARSEFLINVYRTETRKMVDLYNDGVKRPVVEFGRGRFLFFNRERKQKLYDLAFSTKKKNYGLVKSNFYGQFWENYPVDEEAYRKKKMEAFARFEQRTKEKKDLLRDKIILKMHKDGLKSREIAQSIKETFSFNITPQYIDYIVKRNLDPHSVRFTEENDA